MDPWKLYYACTSVADPDRKNADADPEKKISMRMRIHALTELRRAKS